VAIAAVLLAALLVLLLVPARVLLRASGDPEGGVEVALSWRLLVLHGSRRRRLTLAPAAAAPAERIASGEAAARLGPAAHTGTARPSPPPPPPPPPRSAPAGRGLRDRLDDLERAAGVVRSLIARRALRVTRLGGWLEFALRDPGETGRLYGALCALATVLDPHGRLALQPRWDTEDHLAADVALELRVHPLRTLIVLLAERLHRRAPRVAPGGPPAAREGSAGGSLAA
jgi:hypothetical protein